jgi:hypothetical protein
MVAKLLYWLVSVKGPGGQLFFLYKEMDCLHAFQYGMHMSF